MEAVPLHGDGWSKGFDILVLPLKLDQYWEAFWADDAPYYFPAARGRIEPDDEVLTLTKWNIPREGYEKQLEMPVI